MPEDTLQEQVWVDVEARNVELQPLERLDTLLNSIDTRISRINSGGNLLSRTTSQLASLIKGQKGVTGTSGEQGLGDVSKAFFPKDEQIRRNFEDFARRFQAEQKKAAKKYFRSTDTFASPDKAAAFTADVFQRQSVGSFPISKTPAKAIPAAAVSGAVAVDAGQIKATLTGGQIPLIIDASQIVAQLRGQVALPVTGAAAGAVAATKARAGSGGGGGGRKKSGVAASLPPVDGDEFSVRQTEDAAGLVERRVKRLVGTNKSITEINKRVRGELEKIVVTEDSPGKTALDAEKKFRNDLLKERAEEVAAARREKRLKDLPDIERKFARKIGAGAGELDRKAIGETLSREIDEQNRRAGEILENRARSLEKAFNASRVSEALKRRIAQIDNRLKTEIKAAAGSADEIARARKRAADEFENIAGRVANTRRSDDRFSSVDRGALAADLRQRAGTQRTLSGADEVKAINQRADAAAKLQKTIADIERKELKRQEILRAERQAVLDVAKAEKYRQNLVEDGFTKRRDQQRQNQRGLRQQQIFEKEVDGRKEIRTVTTDRDRSGKELGATITTTSQALKGLRSEATAAGQDFLRNTAKVTTWAASVGVLYGSLNLARAGLGSLIETGAQTARLDQVFSGIGGTTEELVNDTLALASANGRNADEALEASIQWSRLGLSYRDTLKAVEISLKAANIAELSAGDATKKLQAIYQGFGLTVRQLESFLGQINETTNTYNVTNAELLEGIARVGGVARQAGLELAELQGIIGATVGDTGQSGANIGNAIKSVIVALGNPAVQEFLGKEFNINVRTEGGADLKDFSGILSDLFVEYQRLTKAERQLLLFRVANKTQASRLASVLDSYVRAQVLAINGQLNLNSAEAENTKILATMKSRLQGVGAELERFVNVQGSAAGKHVFTPILEGLRNVLRVINAGGPVVGGFLALFSVLAARMALTFVQMSRGGQATGFLANTIARVTGLFHLFNGALARTTHGMRVAARNSNFLTRGVVGLGARVQLAGLQLQRASRHATLFGHSVAGAGRIAGRSLRLLGGAITAVGSSLVSLIGIGAGLFVFNEAMDAIGFSSNRAQKKVEKFSNQVEQARNAQEAAARAAKLFATSQRALDNISDRRDRTRLLETLSEAAFPEESGETRQPRTDALKGELISLDQINDKTRLRNRLEEIRTSLLDEQRAQQRLKVQGITNQLASLRTEVARLEKVSTVPFIDYFTGASGRVEDFKRQITELEGKRVEIQLQVSQEVMEDFVEGNLDVERSLKRQAAQVDNIKLLYDTLETSSEGQRAELDLAANKAQVALLERTLEMGERDVKLAAQNAAFRSDEVERLRERHDLLIAQGGALRDQAAILERKLFTAKGTPLISVGSDQAEGYLPPESELSKTRDLLDGVRDKIKDNEQAAADAGVALEEFIKNSDSVLNQDGKYAGRQFEKQKAQERLNELLKEQDALEEKITAARQRDVIRSETRIEKSVIKAQTFGENESEQIAALFREADMESGRLQSSLRLINNEHTTAAQRLREVARVQTWLSEMSEAGVRIQERSNELELEKKRIIKEQAEAYSSALLQSGPSELLSRLAVRNFGTSFQNDPSKLFAFRPEFRRLATEDPASGVNPRLNALRREESLNSLGNENIEELKGRILDVSNQLNESLRKYPLTLETATIRQEQLTKETAATAERIVALGAASGTATEALTNLADRVVEIGETLGGVQQQIAGLRFNNGTNVAAGAPSIPAQEAYAA